MFEPGFNLLLEGGIVPQQRTQNVGFILSSQTKERERERGRERVKERKISAPFIAP